MDEKQISTINSVSLSCTNLLVQQEKQQYFCNLYYLATLGWEIDRQDKFGNACPFSVLSLPSSQHHPIMCQMRLSFYAVIPPLRRMEIHREHACL